MHLFLLNDSYFAFKYVFYILVHFLVVCFIVRRTQRNKQVQLNTGGKIKSEALVVLSFLKQTLFKAITVRETKQTSRDQYFNDQWHPLCAEFELLPSGCRHHKALLCHKLLTFTCKFLFLANSYIESHIIYLKYLYTFYLIHFMYTDCQDGKKHSVSYFVVDYGQLEDRVTVSMLQQVVSLHEVLLT